MKILVTGCCGFIGRHLTDRLLTEGYNVIGIDDFSTSPKDWEYVEKLSDFFCIDLGNVSQIDLNWILDDVDIVFHLAAKARVQPSFENPIDWHNTNVTGTLKLLEAFKVNNKKNKKFIFSSSSSVYGLSAKYGQSENSKLYPFSPYALQKMQAEQLCSFYESTFGIQSICLRYFNVYGENQPVSGNYPQLIPILLDRYKNKKPFTIYGDGENRRDYTYVGDVVEANILSMISKSTGTFNIGTGTNYSVNEICDLIDSNHPREFLPARVEPCSTRAISYKAKEYLKWIPTTTISDWIRKQI